MQRLFTRILVPVSFGRSTHWLVDKAVQLANKFDCDILLLHVQSPSLIDRLFCNTIVPNPYDNFSFAGMEIWMEDLKQKQKMKLKEGLLMKSTIMYGWWQSILKDVIIAQHIDLTIIAQNANQYSNSIVPRINIDKLSQQTNCPVMTLPRSFNVRDLQNIVVPVNDVLSVKKLRIATFLSQGNRGCIYLMGKEEQFTAKTEKGSLMRSYRLLSDFGKLNIQCALRDNDDTARGILTYAKDVKANLIVVNPGQESQIKGWWRKSMEKCRLNESSISVMTVSV